MRPRHRHDWRACAGNQPRNCLLYTSVVEEINEELLDSPELINTDANEAWMIRVKDITDQEELMDAADYEVFVETRQK